MVSAEEIARCCITRKQLLAIRERRLSSERMAEFFIGAFVRVHPPSQTTYRVLQVRDVDDVEAYRCYAPRRGESGWEVRGLWLRGERGHCYSFLDVSDSPPSAAEVEELRVAVAERRVSVSRAEMESFAARFDEEQEAAAAASAAGAK